MESELSVVLPAYRVLDYLPAALASWKAVPIPVQVIVVDDGNSPPLLENDLLAKDVRLIRLARNSGIAAARNAGLREATSPFVMFFDADDIVEPGGVCRVLEVARECRDGAFGRLCEFGAIENIDPARAALASKPHALPGTTVLRTDSVRRLDGFDENLRVGEFVDLMARGIGASWQLARVDSLVMWRRVHDRNMTRSAAADSRDYLAIARRHVTSRN